MSAWYEVEKEMEQLQEEEEKQRLALQIKEYLDPPPTDRVKTHSDGGSTSYYTIPDHATELRHMISYKNMSKSRGDVFKACYRLGEKEGVDIMYELNKMEFFVHDLKEMYERGEHV